MSILGVWAEEIDFTTPTQIETAGGTFRSGYARCAIRQGYNYTVAQSRPLASPITSGWFGFRMKASAATEANRIWAALALQTTLYGWGVGTGAAVNRLGIYKFDSGGGTLMASEVGASFDATAPHRLDLWIEGLGAGKTIKLYLNGIEKVSYTGDTSAGGAITGMDVVRLTLNTGSGSYTHAYSEIIVADEDTCGMSLVTNAPNASGDSKVNWVGDYDAIDEITPLSDADNVNSNTNDAEMQVNVLPTPAGSFAVKAAIISARCTKGAGSTPTKIALGVKTGGSINAGSDQALTTAWATYQRIMGVNPVTTNPWTTAEIDAVQVNLKARA